jgi:hypothetical protein
LQECCQQAREALEPGWQCTEPVKGSVKNRFHNWNKADMNLANVNVCAVLVDLRVILVKDGGVCLEIRRNLVACIVMDNDVSCRAVLAGVP